MPLRCTILFCASRRPRPSLSTGSPFAPEFPRPSFHAAGVRQRITTGSHPSPHWAVHGPAASRSSLTNGRHSHVLRRHAFSRLRRPAHRRAREAQATERANQAGSSRIQLAGAAGVQEPDTFSVVMSNGSEISAAAVWRQDEWLQYVTADGTAGIVRISAVNRDATMMLNREKGLRLGW